MSFTSCRKKSGLRQIDVANALGLNKQVVYAWERGISHPKVGMMKQVADVLGCTLDELLAADEEEKTEDG